MDKTSELIEEPLLQSLMEVAKQLIRAIHLRGFYPKGHGAVGSSIDELKRALDPILSERGEATIGSTGDALVYGKVPFGEDKKPVRDLARHMKVRDMSGITFRSGVSHSELEGAVEILSASPDALESPAPDPGSEHVEIRLIRYDRVIRYVSEEQAGASSQDGIGELWRSIIMDDLYGHGSGLDERAKSMIADSVADRASFRRMTGGLLEESERFDGDKTAFVASGLAKACEGLAGMNGNLRESGVRFLAEELRIVDPEVILRLLENKEDGGSQQGQALLAEASQSLPTQVKLTLLATLIRAHKADSSRVSSVFRRLVGAEARRRDLLSAFAKEARSQSHRGRDSVQELVSAISELVVSEDETKFVGSSYVSMLEELGGEPDSPPGKLDGGSTRLDSLRESLEPARLAVSKALFLADLAAIQPDIEKVELTLDELKSTCDSRREEGDFEPSVTATCRILAHQTRLGGKDPDRSEHLLKCFRSLFTGDTAALVIERLSNESDGRLRSALEQAGSIDLACDYAARVKGALDNDGIRDYLAAHAEEAADYFGGRIEEAGAVRCRRILELLSTLDTPKAIEHIGSALRHADHGVQADAVRALARIGSNSANDVLKRLLDEEDGHMAMEAADALAEAKSQGAAELLLSSLRPIDLFGRRIPKMRRVARGLGRLRARISVPGLEAVLLKRSLAAPNSKRKLREAVALALKAIGSEDAMTALHRGASCRNRQVRAVCSEALGLHGRRAASRGVGKRAAREAPAERG